MTKRSILLSAIAILLVGGLLPSKAEAAPPLPVLQQQSIVEDVICIGCRRVIRRPAVVVGPVVRRPVRRTVRRATRPWRW